MAAQFEHLNSGHTKLEIKITLKKMGENYFRR